MRGRPWTDYKQAGLVNSGEIVTVADKIKEAPWYMISRVGAVFGFVRQNYLEPKTGLASADTSDKPAAEDNVAPVAVQAKRGCRTVEQP